MECGRLHMLVIFIFNRGPHLFPLAPHLTLFLKRTSYWWGTKSFSWAVGSALSAWEWESPWPRKGSNTNTGKKILITRALCSLHPILFIRRSLFWSTTENPSLNLSSSSNTSMRHGEEHRRWCPKILTVGRVPCFGLSSLTRRWVQST